ncbi:hypothetical protein ACFFGR_09195 [Arthrobacter liuii]|uniref:Uncharacterized protein n=1 Tax=Arthrobacter liuii TaxID=1476996 RepID=A0ABQ2AMD2_9MICC|nr:hypothetical protein [Arthrobacter liuii]GGH93760.1 hypothetical protein GCM10007170_15380 [Arthrobacter liuii]
MNYDEKSLETLNLIKAQTAGVTSGTGIVGVDLSDLVSNIPVNTPFFDSVAKKAAPEGAKYAQWRVLTNINNLQADPGTAFDYSAPLALLNEFDVSAPYGKIGYGYTVTRDAINFAKGYADAHAIAVMNAMNQYKIGAERKLLGGQVFALQTPGTPTVTTSTTGGTIAATTAVNVKVAARTGSNFNYGGSTIASAQGTVTTGTGATNSASASVTAVAGAVAYDWYVGGFYYTTTTVNKVSITAIPTANQPVPNIPGIYGVAPTAVPTSDSSAKATDFNGLLATLAGDYATGGATGLVTKGNGSSSGATIQSLDGAAFTSSGQSINELDALNSALFNNIQASPTRYLISSQEANSISKLLLSTAGGGTTFLAPGDTGRNNITAGGFIGHYINKAAGGIPVPLVVMPHLTPGTLIAVSDSGAPFAGANISNVFEMRQLDDVADYRYATSRNANVAGGGPREDGEVFSTSALINKAPVGCAILSNISAN